MTLGTLFLMILTMHLVLIAYGVVGARRRLAGWGLLVAEALLVLLLPAALVALLLATGESEIVRQWGRFLIAMPIVGAMVAALAEQIARRVEP